MKTYSSGELRPRKSSPTSQGRPRAHGASRGRAQRATWRRLSGETRAAMPRARCGCWEVAVRRSAPPRVVAGLRPVPAPARKPHVSAERQPCDSASGGGPESATFSSRLVLQTAGCWDLAGLRSASAAWQPRSQENVRLTARAAAR